MNIPVSILVSASLLSAALFFGLLLGDRYQIVRDQDYRAWRVDKLTGALSTCYSADRTCRAFPNNSN